MLKQNGETARGNTQAGEEEIPMMNFWKKSFLRKQSLDVFDQLPNYSGEQIRWFGQVMLEKFNVKLNIIPDPDRGYMKPVWNPATWEISLSGETIPMNISRRFRRVLLFDWNRGMIFDRLRSVY